MGQDVDYQTVPGLLRPRCPGMKMAVSIGYIQKGFLWRKFDPPKWFPWGFNLDGDGWAEHSAIRYCPFCGIDLDRSE